MRRHLTLVEVEWWAANGGKVVSLILSDGQQREGDEEGRKFLRIIEIKQWTLQNHERSFPVQVRDSDLSSKDSILRVPRKVADATIYWWPYIGHTRGELSMFCGLVLWSRFKGLFWAPILSAKSKGTVEKSLRYSATLCWSWLRTIFLFRHIKWLCTLPFHIRVVHHVDAIIGCVCCRRQWW